METVNGGDDVVGGERLAIIAQNFRQTLVGGVFLMNQSVNIVLMLIIGDIDNRCKGGTRNNEKASGSHEEQKHGGDPACGGCCCSRW